MAVDPLDTSSERFISITIIEIKILVSFMNKIKFNIDQRLNFKAKVKAHQENNLFKVQETRLNYLRITKNAK